MRPRFKRAMKAKGRTVSGQENPPAAQGQPGDLIEVDSTRHYGMCPKCRSVSPRPAPDHQGTTLDDMTNLHTPDQQSNHPQARQLELPLLFAPSIVKDHGLRVAHPRPMVSYGKTDAPFTSFRTTPKKAWSFPQLEYANAGSSWAALVLDCDNPRKMGLGLLDLPTPNWTVTRISNGHAHLVWTLADPVHKYSAAKIEPQRYFAAIAEYYAETLGADPGYSGLLAHNPAPRMRQAEFTTTWGCEAPYAMDKLANVIPFNWSAPTVRQTGVGRNCDLFQSGMRWAGRQANVDLDVHREKIERKMTPADISEAQKRARICMASNYTDCE